MSRRLLALVLVLALPGCASFISRTTARLAGGLTAAMLDQNDPATVRDGAPAYLLMVDGLVETSPDDPRLLLAGAQLYGAYTGAFVEDPARARRLSTRALLYARHALAVEKPDLEARVDQPFDEFVAELEKVGSDDLRLLYGFAAAWAGWIQAHSDDWNAIADLPKVEAVLKRIVALDDDYEDGTAHLYLGVLNTQLPPALGGHPEVGRRHFERAIQLSQDRNLMAKVLFAQRYARLVFDRELHDQLLTEVLAADPEAPGLTLSNVLAQEQAQVLLDTSGDYF